VELRVTDGDHLWSLWKVAIVDALGLIDARLASGSTPAAARP
jgi:S-formylglutathione hydrolase FrmB